jgi:predicted ATPase
MRAVDIPQADSLSRIRELVQTIHFGAADTARLQMVMSLHPRHVGYHLHAARVLDWIVRAEDTWGVTDLGKELIATAAGSQDERAIYRKAINGSPYLSAVAPNLLDDQEPEQDLLSLRIQEVAGIAPATARRRASTLLRWRTQSLPTRVRRFEISDVSDDDEANREGMRVHAAHIERYGLLASVRTEFGESPVFVGENGTGKSTLFDVFRFLSDALHDGIPTAIAKRGDRFEDLVWFGEGDTFAFALEFTIPRAARYDLARARYEVEIGRLESGEIGLSREAMYLCPRELPAQQVVHGNTPRGWRKVLGMGQTGQARYGSEHPSSRKTTTAPVGNQALGLSQLPDDPERFPAARRVRNILAGGVQLIQFTASALCEPVATDAAVEIDESGLGLAGVVHALENGPKDRYTAWLSHVSEAIPGIEAVRTTEADSQRSIVVKMKGGVELPVRRLSNGSILVLGLAALPYQERRDSVVILESPESCIHPRAIEPLAQALATDSSTQIMTTTYSPLWVAAVSADRLRRFVREAGAIRILPGLELSTGDENTEIDVPVFFAAGLI